MDVNFDLEENKLKRKLSSSFKKLIHDKLHVNLIAKKSFKKGEFIVKENEPVHGIYFILEGKVKIYRLAKNNKNQILRFASENEFVGFSCLTANNYWSSAIALETVETYFINLKNLKLNIETNKKFGLLLLKSLALKLKYYEIHQKNMQSYDSKEQVINALLILGAKFGNVTELGLEIINCPTRVDIASFSSISEANCIRILSKLKKENYITLLNRKIILKDPESLRKLLSQMDKNTNTIDAVINN